MNAAQKKAAQEAAQKVKAEPLPSTALDTTDSGMDAVSDAAEAALSNAAPAHFKTAPGGMPTGARIARMASIEEEILMLDLETKKILLEQTRESNTNYVQDKAQRERASALAQDILNSAFRTQLRIEAGCRHRTGGFGIEDLYLGKKEPSIVAMELPVVGRRILLCFRCLKTVTTPDPNLRHTDIEKYLEQTADYKEFMSLERESLSKTMGGPAFTFEKDGLPHNPAIV
jgi:hypothetical protein